MAILYFAQGHKMLSAVKAQRKPQKLGEVARGRSNNLNELRVIAACLVIISHSFALLHGPIGSTGDPLSALTQDLLSMGGLAVGVFFLFGGYLISNSCTTSKTGKQFFKKRILRIFPELYIVLLLTVFILGPCFSTLSLTDYFFNLDTVLFLKNALLIPTYYLPGVFEHAPYPNVVNGSLWTLPVEFGCYILVFICFKLTSFEKRRYCALCIPCIIVTFAYFIALYPIQLTAVRPVLLFWVGATLYVFRDNIPYCRQVYALAIPAGILLTIAGHSTLAMLLCFPPALFFLAYDLPLSPAVKKIWSRVELSYGMYLWGMPVGQALVQSVPAIDVLELSIATLLISAVLGAITNRLSILLLGVGSAKRDKSR